MAFADLPQHADAIRLLQRSLQRGRLGHAYLFTGEHIEALETLARNFACALLCQQPVLSSDAEPLPDACDRCQPCRKVAEELHPDVTWLRPESKSRQIRVEQTRELIRILNLKPTQAAYKIGVISGADRLNDSAANSFLKTLEEPPAQSILLLLSTEPGRILETILSRCLRLSFAAGEAWRPPEEDLSWLKAFAESAVRDQGSLLARYRLLCLLIARLGPLRERIQARLEEKSPLAKYDDADPEQRDKWEEELKAAVEAEYRHQRGQLLNGLQWWLRDIWLQTRGIASKELAHPTLQNFTAAVAARLTPDQAMENLNVMERLRRLLESNVQESLALEVGLLQLKL